MGEFPSGQRGQTVNLLRIASMVRIRPPPPQNSQHLMVLAVLFCAEVRIRTIKCSADERCRRRLEVAEPLFLPSGQKCKRIRPPLSVVLPQPTWLFRRKANPSSPVFLGPESIHTKPLSFRIAVFAIGTRLLQRIHHSGSLFSFPASWPINSQE